MANKRFSKTIAMLAVLAMLAAMVPMGAFASNTVEITAPESVAVDGAITVSGTLSGEGDITMMAYRSNAQLNSIPDEIDTARIMYVDQVTADAEGKAEWTFNLRDTEVDGQYLYVFMGGTEVSQYTSVVILLANSAGTVDLSENDKDYYVDGTQVLDLSQANDGFLNAVTINVYGSDDALAGTIDDNGVLTLTSAPDSVTAYTIKFEGADGYAAPDDIDFEAVSADGAAVLEYAGEATVTEGDEAYTITVPAGADGVEIAVKVDNVDKTADVSEGAITVARNDEGGDAKVVQVIATKGNAEKVIKTVNVPAKGAVAAVSAEDVTIASRDNVYGVAGGKLVKIAAGSIEYTTQSITVGNATFYYSPDKTAFYGVVTASDVDSSTVTADAVAAAAAISDTASSVFYFGKANNPSSVRGAKVTAGDVAATKKIVLKTSTPGIDTYLAADVNSAEPDGNITAGDVSALKKNVLNTTVLPVLE